MRVLALLGTRPEIIRLSSVLRALADSHELSICYTGQNFDPNLSDVFVRELDVPPITHNLNASSPSLATFMSNLFAGFGAVLDEVEPDALVVLGDTNSALGAILASRRRIPVYHLEAGNRSFDRRVPEETNRRLLDHLADFNLAYTEHARRHLLAEGLHPRTVTVTGSPLREVLDTFADRLDDDGACRAAGVRPGEFVLVSLHREENVDSRPHLLGLVEGCSALADELGCQVLVTAHPRFRKQVAGLEFASNWILAEPFGYFQYMALQRTARLVVSDSGSVPEEAAMLGFPAITPRWSSERPEALETGSVLLASTDPAYLRATGLSAVRSWEAGQRPACPVDYLVPDTSKRVVSFLESTMRVAPFWAGLTGPQ